MGKSGKIEGARLDSPHLPGQRSEKWLKSRNGSHDHYMDKEFQDRAKAAGIAVYRRAEATVFTERSR